MANGASLQELHVWQVGSRNVNNGTNVAISSSALFGFMLHFTLDTIFVWLEVQS